MSGPEKEGQGRNFLARWSHRKQEAKRPDLEQGAADAAPSPDPPAMQAETATEPEFDLSTLPKLEELTGTTDITAFLRKGVPEHLRNAALQKSWALDPAIRNYVNPALEYAYDWNTPGGFPGSSELGAGIDVARLVSQIMGEESAAEPAKPSPAGGEVAESIAAPDLRAEPRRLSEEPTAKSGAVSMAGADTEITETEKARSVDDAAPQQQVRRHGTAKPIG
jgi:Protein of unknown function (DUF3306)